MGCKDNNISLYVSTLFMKAVQLDVHSGKNFILRVRARRTRIIERVNSVPACLAFGPSTCFDERIPQLIHWRKNSGEKSEKVSKCTSDAEALAPTIRCGADEDQSFDVKGCL